MPEQFFVLPNLNSIMNALPVTEWRSSGSARYEGLSGNILFVIEAAGPLTQLRVLTDLKSLAYAASAHLLEAVGYDTSIALEMATNLAQIGRSVRKACITGEGLIVKAEEWTGSGYPQYEWITYVLTQMDSEWEQNPSLTRCEVS